jgi:hypothetical protein
MMGAVTPETRKKKFDVAVNKCLHIDASSWSFLLILNHDARNHEFKTYRHLGLIYLPPIYCSKGQPVAFITTVSFYTTILRNIQLIQSTPFQYFSLLPPFTFRCTRYYTCCLEMCKLYKFDSQDDYEYRSEGPNDTTP